MVDQLSFKGTHDYRYRITFSNGNVREVSSLQWNRFQQIDRIIYEETKISFALTRNNWSVFQNHLT